MKGYIAFLVTYNRSSRLGNVIDGILNQEFPPRKIVLVNNASTDETMQVLSSFDSQILHTISTDSNIGHGAALAVGLQWYLENDFRDENIMLFEDDSVAAPSLAQYMIYHLQASSYDLVALDGYLVKVGRREKPVLNDQTPTEVDFALLDGCVFHSSLLNKVGVPVTNWFMMYDDVEYCYRIKKHGLKIGAVKNLHHDIEHLGAKTSPWRAYYQTRNHIHFSRMYPTIRNILDLILLEGKRLVGSVGTSKFGYRLRGWRDGLMGVYGRTVEP